MVKKSAFIFILLLVLGVIISGCSKNKNQTETAARNNGGEVSSAVSTVGGNTGSSSSTNVAWNFFDSQKDAGTKMAYTLKYPSDWIQAGGSDGRQFSNVPFYKKDIYLEKCEKNINNSLTCGATGKIAEVYISSSEEMKENKDYLKGRKFKIENVQGYILVADHGKSIEEKYYPFVSDKEIQYVIPEINGVRFVFAMALENKESEETFYKVLETIKFNGVKSNTENNDDEIFNTATSTVNWQIFKNNEYGFEFKFQPYWEKAAYGVEGELESTIKKMNLYNNYKSKQSESLPLLNVTIYGSNKKFNDSSDDFVGNFSNSKEINGVEVRIFKQASYFGTSYSGIIKLKNNNTLLIKVAQIKDEKETLIIFNQIISTFKLI